MMPKPVSIVLLAVLVNSLCYCHSDKKKEAEIILQKLSLDQKIGQLLMVGLPGREIGSTEKKIMKKFKPGGIVLFGYNVGTEKNTKRYIDSVQELAIKESGIPLFVSIDQEGGRVKRILHGVSQFPGNMAMGVVNDRKLTFTMATILGMQLRNVGVNMNLAPVLDVNNNPENPVINTRSFGSSEAIVSVMGKMYIKGLQKSRCIAVGKHFPGHGDTNKDSHKLLPVIKHTMDRLEKIELVPFKTAIRNGVECIMTAHISYPVLNESDLPATVSKKILNGLLREKLKFKGIIISDDMEMDAISEIMEIGKAAVRSFEAGADIILVSTYGKSIKTIFEALKKACISKRISEKRLNDSIRRILELKLRYGIIDIHENKVRLSKPEYSATEIKMLKEAEKINALLSAKALYYKNKKDILHAGLKSSPVILVSNIGILNKEMRRYNWEALFITNNIIEAKRLFLKFKKMQPVLLYHAYDITAREVKRIESLYNYTSGEMIVLSTGNPFPLKEIDPLPDTIITFSNTQESYIQLVQCLRGKIKPRKSINVKLGFPVR